MVCRPVLLFNLFLSTLSLRRATCWTVYQFDDKQHFYPRSPCGERQRLSIKIRLELLISIHALLAESDGLKLVKANTSEHLISIHALLAESDAL